MTHDTEAAEVGSMSGWRHCHVAYVNFSGRQPSLGLGQTVQVFDYMSSCYLLRRPLYGTLHARRAH
jgi:hypothetical protein